MTFWKRLPKETPILKWGHVQLTTLLTTVADFNRVKVKCRYCGWITGRKRKVVQHSSGRGRSRAATERSVLEQAVAAGHSQDGRPSGNTREGARGASDVNVRVRQRLLGVHTMLERIYRL